jgi:hypothetical protein
MSEQGYSTGFLMQGAFTSRIIALIPQIGYFVNDDRISVGSLIS